MKKNLFKQFIDSLTDENDSNQKDMNIDYLDAMLLTGELPTPDNMKEHDIEEILDRLRKKKEISNDNTKEEDSKNNK